MNKYKIYKLGQNNENISLCTAIAKNPTLALGKASDVFGPEIFIQTNQAIYMLDETAFNICKNKWIAKLNKKEVK